MTDDLPLIERTGARRDVDVIVVHHLENSRSQRIIWLLEELGLAYVVKHYRRLDTMAAPQELKQIHPLGKSPIIEDGDFAIAETGAIVEYLVEKADGLLGPPADRIQALNYRFFLHYAEGSITPALLRMTSDNASTLVYPHLDYVDLELASRPWFAGTEFTAADIMMCFPLQIAASSCGNLERWGNISAWLQKIMKRDSYISAQHNIHRPS